MLIPYNTDAPIYHWPFATVGTIIVNVLLFIPTLSMSHPYEHAELTKDQLNQIDQEIIRFKDPNSIIQGDDDAPLTQAEKSEVVQLLTELRDQALARQKAGDGTSIYRLMTLEFGKFRPWQWLTANYMHADLFHLLGNMFVLWGFGLVVEGKVGPLLFLVLYNAIGILGWAFVQMLTIFASTGIGLGASLAIFGIVAIALIWAPSNDMECIFLLGFRPILFSASVMTIAMFSLFLQVAISVFHVLRASDISSAMAITSEVLHLIGGVLGLAVGVITVKKNWVDCENWDAFSVWSGKHLKSLREHEEDAVALLHRQTLAKKAKAAQSTSVDRKQSLIKQFREQLLAQQGTAAFDTHLLLTHQFPDWKAHELEFAQLVQVLYSQQIWDKTVRALVFYLKTYSERQVSFRLSLAQILIQVFKRPRQAYQVLGKVNQGLLNPQQREIFLKLVQAARGMAPQVTNEPAPQDW